MVRAQELGELEQQQGLPVGSGSDAVDKYIASQHELFKIGMPYASETKADRDKRDRKTCGRPRAPTL